MSKKYAYFISCQIGMQKNWLGQDLACCHHQVSEPVQVGDEVVMQPIKKREFDQMKIFFLDELENSDFNQEIID